MFAVICNDFSVGWHGRLSRNPCPCVSKTSLFVWTDVAQHVSVSKVRQPCTRFAAVDPCGGC